MKKFPSINQYRNVIKNIQGHVKHSSTLSGKFVPMPKLKMVGTVKLHGTNAGIVYDFKTDELVFQSKERELSLHEDNMGFMMYMSQHKEILTELFHGIYNSECVSGVDIDTISLVIYGEWCAGNIQSGVALSGLPKMFVIFKIKAYYGDVDSDVEPFGVWLDVEKLKHIHSPEHKIYNIFNFPHYELTIDFEHPYLYTNEMVEITTEIEAECPVGKSFGVSGVGEGVVWSPAYSEGQEWNSSEFYFKVKGDKHSVSKVKKLVSVDVESITKINDFIEYAVTESRLEQGLQNLVNEQLKPFEMTSMGDFIRWIYNDIIKEETDTIIENQFDIKKLGGPIANTSRKWYISRYNEDTVGELI